jgi:hypothetical protein
MRHPAQIISTNLRIIIFPLLALSPIVSLAAGTAGYSYRQLNWDALNREVIYEDSFGPIPAPVSDTVLTPNSQLVFRASGVQMDPTSLSSKTTLQVQANQQGKEEAWVSVQAQATADASLVDLATVEGVVGIPAGTVRFHWVVTGSSMLMLDTSGGNLVDVEDLSIVATLQSSIPGASGTLIEEIYEFPDPTSFNRQWSESYEAASGALVFEVPWQAGQELPVFFDLTTTAQLDITNQDAGRFLAELDADFGNTAQMLGVDVLDPTGEPIPTARLVSQTGFRYPTVPEPGGLLLLLLGAGASCPFVGTRARRSTRRRPVLVA